MTGIEKVAEPEVIAQFVQAVHGRSPGLVEIFVLPRKVAGFDPVADVVAESEFLAELAEAGSTIYIGCATLGSEPAAGCRGSEPDTLAIPGVWADIDTTEGSHGVSPSGMPLPGSEGATELINSLGLEPSVLVHSGGGLQAWWLFEEPWVFTTPEEREKAKWFSGLFGATLVEHGRRMGFHVDNVSDLPRLLRPAGTVNHKQGGAPVRLLTFEPTLMYHRHEIEAAFLPGVELPAPPPARPAPVRRSLGGSMGERLAEGPADWLGRNYDWAELVEPHGWRCVGSRGEERQWRHPTATSEQSATTDHNGVPVLVNFSPNAGLPVGPGHHLTKFRVFALLNHGGDESAAAYAIQQARRGVA
jgi:hypothetical protein